MKAQPDKDQWYEKAECAGEPIRNWVFAQEPPEEVVDHCLSVCERCPVVQACAQDYVNAKHTRHPFEVRAGVRMWVNDDVDRLPDVVQYTYEPPPKPVGRPRGPLSILHIAPTPNPRFNPHTRGPWNTEMPS